MKPTLLIGIALCILSALALAYQGFTFTYREKVLDVGPIHATREKEESVPLPPILGFVGLATGLVLIVVGRK